MSETNDQLRQRIEELIPINELSPNLQNKLLERGKILDVKKSRFLFKQGDKDDYSYYLLDGEVELHQNNQLNGVITANTDRAKYALAQLQPRQFSVKAKTEVKILLIERNQLDQLMLLSQESTLNPATNSGGTVIEVDEVDDTDWMTTMLQSELFSRIPTANIHQLFALLEEIPFKAGDVVIKQGDPGEHYYIISEGRCAVSRKPSPQSKDVKLAELKVGDSFGEEALISESTRNATVTMMTDGILMQLAKDTFVELVKNPTLQSLKFDEAEALVNEGSAKWLDVRFPNEFKESSIEGSINIPLNSLRLQADKLESSTIYILFCDTGNRSSTGTFLLAERGYDVTYLDGGLLNNPEAVGEQTVVPKVPEPEPKIEPKPEPAPVKQATAAVETTPPEAKKEAADAEAEAIKKKEFEENKKKLEEAKRKLEDQKKIAEAEAKKAAEQEELKLKKLKEETDKKMEAEQKKLEEIYNKNAEDMEKLQKAKETAEEELRKEREKLEQQAEEARKQIEEAKRLKQEAEESSRKQLEEVEASRKRLEEDAEKKRLVEEEREKKLQAAAKIKIEEERKKLAQQYERNSKEFEALQKEKAAAEAAREAAKQEAEKMIEEYKTSHDKQREEEQAKLKAERLKLEEEAKLIQEQMKQIQQAKLEVEKMKQEALEQASALKEKQMDSTSSRAQREKLEVEIKAAQEKAIEAEREIEDAAHKEKLTESAKQENEADLINKKKQEEAFLAQIAGDLEEFEEKQEEESASITQVQMQADMMKRIKQRAAEAKKKAAEANNNLLDDISKQLDDK
jgi:CRP-like cAMP-binding protein